MFLIGHHSSNPESTNLFVHTDTLLHAVIEALNVDSKISSFSSEPTLALTSICCEHMYFMTHTLWHTDAILLPSSNTAVPPQRNSEFIGL